MTAGKPVSFELPPLLFELLCTVAEAEHQAPNDYARRLIIEALTSSQATLQQLRGQIELLQRAIAKLQQVSPRPVTDPQTRRSSGEFSLGDWLKEQS